jgi:PhnB protein
MNVRLNPYLNFSNSAEEALKLYQSVFGGELTLSRFGENGMAEDPADANKIMHGQLEAPNGMTLMASDAPPGMPLDKGGSISVSLSGDDETTLRGYWNGLATGGQVTVPLEKAPWGDTFGMLTDKFGIAWLVNITASPS